MQSAPSKCLDDPVGERVAFDSRERPGRLDGQVGLAASWPIHFDAYPPTNDGHVTFLSVNAY